MRAASGVDTYIMRAGCCVAFARLRHHTCVEAIPPLVACGTCEPEGPPEPAAEGREPAGRQGDHMRRHQLSGTQTRRQSAPSPIEADGRVHPWIWICWSRSSSALSPGL